MPNDPRWGQPNMRMQQALCTARAQRPKPAHTVHAGQQFQASCWRALHARLQHCKGCEWHLTRQCLAAASSHTVHVLSQPLRCRQCNLTSGAGQRKHPPTHTASLRPHWAPLGTPACRPLYMLCTQACFAHRPGTDPGNLLHNPKYNSTCASTPA